MPIDVKGEPLTWSAEIETANFEKGIKKITDDTKTLTASIETLRGKAMAKGSFLVEETDIRKIRQYNKEIEVLEVEMKRLQNAGKSGFDDMGNAIVETATKTNALSKGFSFIRTAANILPGIGIAGIFALIGEGIAALTKKLFVGGEAFDAFKARIKSLSDAAASTDFTKAVTNVNELRINIDLAKEGFLSKEAVLKQYNDTIGKTTGQVKSLEEAERALQKNADAYVQMTLYKAAAQIALQDAAKKTVEAEKVRLQQEKDFANAVVDTRVNVGGAGGIGTGSFDAKEYDKETQRIKNAQRNRHDQAYIDAQAAGNKELKLVEEFQRKAAEIAKNNKFDLFGGTLDPKTKKEREININPLIEEGKRLSERIRALQNDAATSGLAKDRSELERIAEKYNVAAKALTSYNEKVTEFNRKNKTNIALKGQDEFSKLDVAKSIEIANTRSKQEAAIYIQSLNKQREIFAEYENAKKDLGLQKASQLYADQTHGFESYQKYLAAEFLKLLAKVQSGFASVGDNLKFTAVGKAIEDAAAKDRQAQIKRFAALLHDTTTYKDQEAAINEKYRQKQDDLDKAYQAGIIDNYDETRAALARMKEGELTDLRNNLIRQSDLYKDLNKDIISYSAAALRVESARLRKVLNDDTTLTPQQKADIEGRIKQLNDLVHSTDTTSIKILKAADQFGAISGGINNLANSLSGINDELAQTLGALGNISGAIGEGLSSLDAFKKAQSEGDQAGQLTAGLGIAGAAMSVVSSFVNMFKAVKQSRIDAQKQVDEFNLRQTLGQVDYNIELRRTEATQIAINKLRIDAIRDQRTLLTQQKEANRLQYEGLLQQIQAQQYVAGTHTERGGGNPLFGLVGSLFGRKSKVVQDLQSLSGSSFDDLEKLFNSGQLTEKAAALFQKLQELKQEGYDIESQLQEARRQAQELFTGTTADNIVDSIADGFAQGFKSVQDFAGKTEDIIRGALLNALKTQALEAPIKKLFEKFAEDAESNGGLDQTEIANFTNSINQTIQDAEKFAEQIQKATGVNLSNVSNSQNSLTGSIRAQLTEETGSVIAGHFNGLRLTAIQQLQVAQSSLSLINKIEANTAQAVVIMAKYYAKWDLSGLKVI